MPIHPCNHCKCSENPGSAAAYQDEHYGPGMRVHNVSKGGNKDPALTCTVCADKKGSVKASAGAAKAPSKVPSTPEAAPPRKK